MSDEERKEAIAALVSKGVAKSTAEAAVDRISSGFVYEQYAYWKNRLMTDLPKEDANG